MPRPGGHNPVQRTARSDMSPEIPLQRAGLFRGQLGHFQMISPSRPSLCILVLPTETTKSHRILLSIGRTYTSDSRSDPRYLSCVSRGSPSRLDPPRVAILPTNSPHFFGPFQNHPPGLSIQLTAHGCSALVDEALELMGRT